MTSSNVVQLIQLKDRCQRIYNMHSRMVEINHTPTLDELRESEAIEFIKDDHGIVLAISKGYTAMTGLSCSEYEGHTDEQVWGKDGEGFELRDSYVRETGFPLETVEAWLNPKDKMYQTGMVLKVPHVLGNGRIGTRGRIYKDSLTYTDAIEYQRITRHDREQ